MSRLKFDGSADTAGCYRKAHSPQEPTEKKNAEGVFRHRLRLEFPRDYNFSKNSQAEQEM
jgi:hypothetical protein